MDRYRGLSPPAIHIEPCGFPMLLLDLRFRGDGVLLSFYDGVAKSHFIVVQTSCLHKILLQAGRLRYNI